MDNGLLILLVLALALLGACSAPDTGISLEGRLPLESTLVIRR